MEFKNKENLKSQKRIKMLRENDKYKNNKFENKGMNAYIKTTGNTLC